MRNLLQKRKESGFTIVEVMIVLAIAGLIILVVFLAVPALQRNSRNTQRNNDISMIGAAINECTNNRNGDTTYCDTVAELTGSYLDLGKLRQITTIATGSAAVANSNTVNIATNTTTGFKCNPEGSAAVAATNKRAVALVFASESTTGTPVPRCQEI